MAQLVPFFVKGEKEERQTKKKERKPKQPPLQALSAKKEDGMRAKTHVSGSREEGKDKSGYEMRGDGT